MNHTAMYNGTFSQSTYINLYQLISTYINFQSVKAVVSKY